MGPEESKHYAAIAIFCRSLLRCIPRRKITLPLYSNYILWFLASWNDNVINITNVLCFLPSYPFILSYPQKVSRSYTEMSKRSAERTQLCGVPVYGYIFSSTWTTFASHYSPTRFKTYVKPILFVTRSIIVS